ncbi:hypothetical protein CSOJ01_04940 [Colletotrichum sojae]|uniref:Uncharacterized protein n=1 Tax=Colletotrichum sojae TaxID=2175907 RepID=A0A8H6JGK4_9PEZI|nr:hypothetical protein CSOJ01_04940 [Colletotrichum sojae]
MATPTRCHEQLSVRPPVSHRPKSDPRPLGAAAVVTVTTSTVARITSHHPHAVPCPTLSPSPSDHPRLVTPPSAEEMCKLDQSMAFSGKTLQTALEGGVESSKSANVQQ